MAEDDVDPPVQLGQATVVSRGPGCFISQRKDWQKEIHAIPKGAIFSGATFLVFRLDCFHSLFISEHNTADKHQHTAPKQQLLQTSSITYQEILHEIP